MPRSLSARSWRTPTYRASTGVCDAVEKADGRGRCQIGLRLICEPARAEPGQSSGGQLGTRLVGSHRAEQGRGARGGRRSRAPGGGASAKQQRLPLLENVRELDAPDWYWGTYPGSSGGLRLHVRGGPGSRTGWSSSANSGHQRWCRSVRAVELTRTPIPVIY